MDITQKFKTSVKNWLLGYMYLCGLYIYQQILNFKLLKKAINFSNMLILL